MTHETADDAINLVLADREDRSNEIHSAIIDCGDEFANACNALSVRVAQRLVDRDLAFVPADAVMNWLWSYMVRCAPTVGEAAMPEPAYSIYDAVDAGEYHHPGDGPDIDPVEKYTIPGLSQILNDAT